MRPWSARVHGAGGICGAAVLITEHHVLTCAHVVNAALGRPPTATTRPESLINLDFPAAPGTPRVQAAVAEDGWFPIEPDERGDIAILHLTTPSPTGT
ncbi:trypsin-like serine protease, partial [Sphaerisporangium aureirubrum]